jgi:hypothetical protein
MSLTMATKKELTQEFAQRYRVSDRTTQSRLLDEFTGTTGYNRKYAIHLLNRWGLSTIIQTDSGLLRLKAGNWKPKPKRQGTPRYGPEIDRSLETLWILFDGICGKRLAAAIRDHAGLLREEPRLGIPTGHWMLLERMSPATIDRHLKPRRDQDLLRGISHTNATTALKQHIPIRTGAEWKDVGPGHLQIDTAGHDGGSGYGQFCFTLNAVDIYSGWTEPRALLNKAKRWVVEGIEDIAGSLPFPLMSIHTDNGGEFINLSMVHACAGLHVAMTRSRPDRKNDNCYVECRNDDVVRHFVGYYRFSTEAARDALAEVWRWAAPYMNFFLPSMRLVEKRRMGGKVMKRHDQPRTPYQRLLDCPDLAPEFKAKLEATMKGLHIVDLKLNLDAAVDNLLKLAEPVVRNHPRTEIRGLPGLDSTHEATASSG